MRHPTFTGMALFLTLLLVSACVDEPIPEVVSGVSEVADDDPISQQAMVTVDDASTDASDGDDLRATCWKWEHYACSLPNGLPSLCRYCVCWRLFDTYGCSDGFFR